MANEYIHIKTMLYLAPLLVSCFDENGKFTTKYLSNDITAIVVIEVIPEKLLIG